MREVGLDLELILTIVNQVCGIKRQERLKLYSRQTGEQLTILLLIHGAV
jgi:hypothetical protein